MSICVRFVSQCKLREEFLEYVQVFDQSGTGLSKTLLSELASLGIDCTYMVGQAYDGARPMSSQLRGVQGEIRRCHAHAIYVHCASHCLNLTIGKSADVTSIRNCVGTIEEAVVFINGYVYSQSDVGIALCQNRLTNPFS